MIELYTTECPRCKVLEKKLDVKGIQYKKILDFNKEEMVRRGYTMMPILSIDGNYYEYKQAVAWIANH